MKIFKGMSDSNQYKLLLNILRYSFSEVDEYAYLTDKEKDIISESEFLLIKDTI